MWLAPLRRPLSLNEKDSPRGAAPQRGVQDCFDLLDCMERGLSRELTSDFMEPLPDNRCLWKFQVERASDRRQYRLLCDGGEFLMYAKLSKNTLRIDIFMYDPCDQETRGVFDTERPAFTLSCNAARTTWRLCQERCDACRQADADSVCGCQGHREIMRVRHSSTSVGEGVNHCMDVHVLPQGHLPVAHEYRLASRMPVWNPQADSMVLDFQSRNVIPSAKNFQLAVEGDDRERVICQYGKIATDSFGLDFRYPLTVIQAFGLSLTTIFWA